MSRRFKSSVLLLDRRDFVRVRIKGLEKMVEAEKARGRRVRVVRGDWGVGDDSKTGVAGIEIATGGR